MARRRVPASAYDVHPGVAMVQKWVAELPEKTGKSLEQWAKLLKKQKIEGVTKQRDWLKEEHGLGTNAAWWVAEYAEGKPTWDADPETYLRSAELYVEEMYAGPKAALKPIFDELVVLGRSLGADVKVCPCKTIVPFYRNRVFAEIKPSTRTRVDFSVALDKGQASTGKLLRNEKKIANNDRLTHGFALASTADITGEVIHWLKLAYDRDG